MSRPSDAPLLLDTATVLLPDRKETLFLKACLRVDTENSWNEWRAGEPVLKKAIAASPACKRLLPLLFFTLTRERIAVAPDDLALLRVAAAWEERRARRVDSLLAAILEELRQNAIEAVVLKGVALAHLAYPKPSLRHCHDIDLLIAGHQHAKAAEVISRLGFSPKKTERPDDARLVLLHEHGLPVSIHADLRAGLPRSFSTAIPARTIRSELAGVSALVLDPPELLLFMAAQLLAGRIRDRTSWVADAVFLLRKTRADDIDWAVLAEQARDRELALVLLAMLTYIESEIGAAIPARALACLRGQARLGAEARDRLLFLLRQNPGVRSSTMLQGSGWRSRLDIFRWMVVPTGAYMRSWCNEKGLRWSRAWYVIRPLRRLSTRAIGATGAARATSRGKDLP